MSSGSYEYEYGAPLAAEAGVSARSAFIRRTYGHLAGAVLAFIGLEALMLYAVDNNELAQQMLATMLSGGRLGWLVVLVAFMGVSWLASYWASSGASPALQYAGLSLYVLAEAVIFVPILYIAHHFFPGSIPTAGILTFAVFAGLTLFALFTRGDFSFLAPVLSVGSLLALGFIILAIFFPAIPLASKIFCFFMVALMSGYILYHTSNVIHHYRVDQHVAAALALFASVATLFWYILQLVMAGRRE